MYSRRVCKRGECNLYSNYEIGKTPFPGDEDNKDSSIGRLIITPGGSIRARQMTSRFHIDKIQSTPFLRIVMSYWYLQQVSDELLTNLRL